MVAAKPVMVQAGGREVRVSSPDRVIYEATDSSAEVTKLMVAEYFASVEDGLMRALRDRPTALERWTSGVRPGMKLATGPQDRNADAFYQKRVPKGAPDYLETATITFPSGRTADEICPTEIAVPVWCAHMGTLTFHPWPVRRTDVDHPDELRIDLDPQPGTTFADAVRVAGVARELLDDLGMTGFAKTSGNRGIHIYVRIEPSWDSTFFDGCTRGGSPGILGWSGGKLSSTGCSSQRSRSGWSEWCTSSIAAHGSPSDASRSGTVKRLNADGDERVASSSHATGVETGAPAIGRRE